MKKFKQCCISLCLLLSFFVGSSWGGNVAYAYVMMEEMCPALWHTEPTFVVANTGGSSISAKQGELVTGQNAYFASTTAASGVGYIQLYTLDGQMDLNYVPELYDYYFFGTVQGQATKASDFSFVPNICYFMDKSCDSASFGAHILQDFKVYHHDDTDTIGFSVFGKLPDDMCNTNIMGFTFRNLNGGTVPAGLRFEGFFIALPKGQSAALADILKTLDNINTNISQQGQSVSSAVNQAAQEISKTVEEQYEMEDGEDFGVGGIVDQVEDQMGVLSFGADVLTGFLDLFSPGNVAGTVITFPAFAMEVGGETYNIWQDLSYDLRELEEQFGFLIDIIRTFLVSMVWLAVLKYIVNSAESFWKG